MDSNFEIMYEMVVNDLTMLSVNTSDIAIVTVIHNISKYETNNLLECAVLEKPKC